jgi:FkbM family methyltransferase
MRERTEYSYLGKGRGLINLSSGGLLIVDTNSIDSMDYIIGREYERDVWNIAQKCLHPGATFIDVGANYGFYSVSASQIVKKERGGKIYSFEANPHTYDFLIRSLYANALAADFAIPANCAISDKAGHLRLRYRLDALGGSSMWMSENSITREPVQEVTIPAFAIDDLVPATVSANLVKVDVEGHEPFVFRGMRKLIQRSPEIVILCEYVPDFIRHHSDPRDYISEILDENLNIWEIEQCTGKIVPFEVDRENHPLANLVLARSLHHLADYKIMADHLSCRPESVPKSILAREGTSICFDSIGDCPSTSLTLFYGPYIEIESGSYQLLVDADVSGHFRLCLTHDNGRFLLALDLTESRNLFDIKIPYKIINSEFVLQTTENSRKIQFRNLRLRVYNDLLPSDAMW